MKSIGHNIAYSLASGDGLLIGIYDINVFAEAATTPGRSLTVDFLEGKCTSGVVSASLSKAIALYASALADLCKRQGANVEDFRRLQSKYCSDRYGGKFIVTVEDRFGQTSIVEYLSRDGRRAIVVDELRRIRPKNLDSNST